MYAADQATEPPAPADVGATITAQKVKGRAGETGAGSEHQAEKLSAEQMTVLVTKYDTESKVAYEHGETTRIQAYARATSSA